jgi:hypothetical protein
MGEEFYGILVFEGDEIPACVNHGDVVVLLVPA